MATTRTVCGCRHKAHHIVLYKRTFRRALAPPEPLACEECFNPILVYAIPTSYPSFCHVGEVGRILKSRMCFQIDQNPQFKNLSRASMAAKGLPIISSEGGIRQAYQRLY